MKRLMLAGAVGLMTVSCARSEDEDLKPPPDFVPPPVRPLQSNPVGAGRLGFGEGFYPAEFGEGTTWRWMGRRGELRLRNNGEPRKLQIAGWLPLEYMKGPPKIRLTLDSKVVADFVGSEHDFVWEYTLRPELLGSSSTVLLAIETSKTVNAPGDTRDLGVSIKRVVWEIAR
jgi:hypothetical protein